MTTRSIPRKTLVAVLVALVAALIARSALQIRFAADGMAADVAADLSYLVVPIVLAVILFPLWHSEKRFVTDQFRRVDLSWRIALSAVAIGVLIRLARWSVYVAKAAFAADGAAHSGPAVETTLLFQCPAPTDLMLGFLIMVFLVPIIEEIIHRGYVLTALGKRGVVISVLVSTLIFMVFHIYSSWLFVFAAGAVFGVQYWLTRSLWQATITHATINAFALIDSRCLSIRWDPHAGDVTTLVLAISIAVFASTVIAIIYLLRRAAIGAHNAPR